MQCYIKFDWGYRTWNLKASGVIMIVEWVWWRTNQHCLGSNVKCKRPLSRKIGHGRLGAQTKVWSAFSRTAKPMELKIFNFPCVELDLFFNSDRELTIGTSIWRSWLNRDMRLGSFLLLVCLMCSSKNMIRNRIHLAQVLYYSYW